MTRDEVHTLIMSFPEVEEAMSYGKPAYKAFGKFFTRIRKADDSLFLGQVDFDERDFLLEVDPDTFHYTEHYRSYPFVLARIANIEPDQARGFLMRQWRKNAPKKWLKQWDSEHPAATP